MSEQKPPPDPLRKNPQVIAAVIGGIITILVAIIGIVPALINATKPAAEAPIVVTATPVPDEPTALPLSSTPVPDVLLATSTSSNEGLPVSAVATVTPLILSTTAPAASANVLLLFDDVSFTVLNQSSAFFSLEGVTFHSANGDWDARDWGPSVYNSLPAGKCLRLRDITKVRQPPQPCVNNIYGLIEVGKSALFWVGVASFDVLLNGQVLATCQISDTTCSFSIS